MGKTFIRFAWLLGVLTMAVGAFASIPIHAPATVHAASVRDCSVQHKDGPWFDFTNHKLRGLHNVTLELWYGGNSKEIAVEVPKFPAKYATAVVHVMGIAYEEPCNVPLKFLIDQAMATEKQRQNTWKLVMIFDVPHHVLRYAKGNRGNVQAASRLFLAHVPGHEHDRIVN